ncbi:putative Zinc finger C-x8-C-x5-C-x3-H type (and similar) [Leishmania naiffi]|uniref:Zinc finger C-x8-C-x5-C-x3-H type (And similar) n=1 Tax=Leishmania naiffi TaxID=5678 RepID=A0AAW3BZN2_9TRYP
MPKANKHAEVKPSKYKTSLCRFFFRGEECPYAGRCAFAHGEHELQTESKNVELLKATGLQRLDGLHTQEIAVVESHTPSINSVTDSGPSESLVLSEPETPTSPVVRLRRRTVMVSLPKNNTRSEMYQSPYNATQYDPCYGEYNRVDYSYLTQPAPQPVYHVQTIESSHAGLYASSNTHDNQYCACRFSATCSQGQPSKYRHNPYGMTGRIAQCA